MISECANGILGSVVHEPDLTWVEARAIADPGGSKFNGSLGTLEIRGLAPNDISVSPDPTPQIEWHEGKLQAFRQLTGTAIVPPKRFRRERPIPYISSMLEWECLEFGTHSFIGTVGSMKQDTAVLTNAMLIPDEWLPDVPAALQFIKDHPRLADGPVGEANVDLNKLLTGKNLLLQATAFRCVAYQDRDDPRLLTALRSAKPTQLSIFIYQILTAGPANPNISSIFIAGAIARRPCLL